MSVEKTLQERGEKYGSFADYAVIANHLKMSYEFSNKKTNFLHDESLDMIFSKIARILNGDPNHIDNWHDIAGYATLVEKELLKND